MPGASLCQMSDCHYTLTIKATGAEPDRILSPGLTLFLTLGYNLLGESILRTLWLERHGEFSSPNPLSDEPEL